MRPFTVEFYRVSEAMRRMRFWTGTQWSRPILRAKVKGISMFDNRDMPQKPDGFRILNPAGDEPTRGASSD